MVASSLLAVLVWRRPRRQLLRVVAGFAAVFAAFDLAEVAHQLGEDDTGLAVLAASIAALHAAAAIIALHRSAAAREQDPAAV